MGPFTGPGGKPAIANQIADNLAKSKEYREVTPAEAQKLANEGKLVVVAWKNPDPHHHGHVATVRPEKPGGPQHAGTGPLINNVGAKNGIMRASQIFRHGGEKYYTPAGSN